jgi:Icc-related predicted phosphoesterase
MSKPNGPPAMKIVALSDTHGLERILTDAVPFGDILIHAGDYAKDGGKNREKYQALDLWLSKLPHRHKIVVRGNHDPPGAKFPLSNALYASKPTTVEIEGIKIALAPYGALKAPEGHILVSHVPPYGVLDEPMKKEKHAGSESLLRSVTRMEHKPQLWIFGHIHEAFGAINHPFRMGGKACADTLCVNAGLANPGRAHSLVNLPVTIEVAEVLREDTHPRVSLSSQEEHKEEEHGEEDHEDDLV